MDKTFFRTSDKIRQFRILKGYTQKQLAEKCGMYESQIRKYETGKANPKIETLQKIAKALEIPVSSLKGDLELAGDKIINYFQHEADQINFFNNYLQELGEFLYHNPHHKELFDASMDIKEADVDLATEMLNRISGNSDGESRSILRTFPTVFVESFFPEMEERILFLSIPFDLLPAVGLTDTQTGLSGTFPQFWGKAV